MEFKSSGSMSGVSVVDIFTKDLITSVLGYLTPRDVGLCSYISREFSMATSANNIWLSFLKITPENLSTFTAKHYFQHCPQYRKFEWLHVDQMGIVEVSKLVNHFKKEYENEKKQCNLSVFQSQYVNRLNHWLSLFLQWGFIEPLNAERFLNINVSEAQISPLMSVSAYSSELVLVTKVHDELKRVKREHNGINILDIRHSNVKQAILKGMSNKDLASMCALNEYTSIFKVGIFPLVSFPLKLLLAVPNKRRNPLFLKTNKDKLCLLLRDIGVLSHPLIAVKLLVCTPLQFKLLYYIFIRKPHEDRENSSTFMSQSTSLNDLKQKHILQLLDMRTDAQTLMIKKKMPIKLILKILDSENKKGAKISISDILNISKLEGIANTRGFDGIGHKVVFIPRRDTQVHQHRTKNIKQQHSTQPVQQSMHHSSHPQVQQNQKNGNNMSTNPIMKLSPKRSRDESDPQSSTEDNNVQFFQKPKTV